MSSIPNALTVGRIVLVPFFVAAFFLPPEPGRWIVFILFCLAGLTDLFDGMIARKLSVGYTTVLRILEHHTAQQ